MTKAKTKRFLMKAALGASLAAGVSLFPLMRHIVSRQTADFDKIRVTVGTDTVSKQQFFERLSYRDGAWRFAASDGTFVNVDSLADFRTKDALLHEYFCKLKLKNSVDTVYVRYAMGSQKKYMSDIVYGMGAKDSLGYLPSFGRYNYDRLNLRYFKADSEELQKVVTTISTIVPTGTNISITLTPFPESAAPDKAMKTNSSSVVLTKCPPTLPSCWNRESIIWKADGICPFSLPVLNFTGRRSRAEKLSRRRGFILKKKSN